MKTAIGNTENKNLGVKKTMRSRITTFVAMTLVCSLCYNTAVYAQEPVRSEDAAEEKVMQVKITAAGVSQNTETAVQPVPRSKKIRVLMVGNSLTSCAGNRTANSALFAKSPVESRYYGGMGKGLAKKLQHIAASQMQEIGNCGTGS